MTTQQILKELNSDTKIRIMCILLRESRPLNVSYLTSQLVHCNKTRINISKQINEMKDAGFFKWSKEGRNIFYEINHDLSTEELKLIKTIVNSFHIIDENKKDFTPYV